MNKNVESHFSLLPHANIQRSTFTRPHRVLTSFDISKLVPLSCDEVLPGDTWNVKTSKVIRMPALLNPFMDNIYLDVFHFFVPSRLVWKHWKNLMGENTETAWVSPTEYTTPKITAPDGGWNVGTLADYFGIPTGVPNLEVNALPFRCYAAVVQDWFRDQNLMDPLVIPDGDETIQGVNTGDQVTDIAKGGLPFIAAKFHDVFSSSLPAPQKGPSVTIPIPAVDKLEVWSTNEAHGHSPNVLSGSTYYAGVKGKDVGLISNNSGTAYNSTYYLADKDDTFGTSNQQGFTPQNLWAMYPSDMPIATINELRLAFQIQRLLEVDSRSGSRYTEVIRSHFGIVSPDARLQRPEYLGGNRIPISVSQVIQNSGTESSGTPQGNVAAMSLTTDVNHDFVKSFTEHGFILTLAVARYDHTYQQGLERMWSRSDRWSYYWPTLAHIGEQALLNKEIYAQGSLAINPDTGKPYDDEVFGYQEAWYEYRYKPNHVTGMMRSQYAESLDSWHLADDYDSLPHLSPEWIREDPNTVDRVLAVSSRLTNQLFGDFYFDCKVTRPMPLYSVPGLIDHF